MSYLRKHELPPLLRAIHDPPKRLYLRGAAEPQLLGRLQLPWVSNAVSDLFSAANHLNMLTTGAMTSFALDSSTRLLDLFRNNF